MHLLNYKTFGKSSKRALIFIHGFLGSSDDFLLYAKKLASQHFIILIDLPGHGDNVFHSPFCFNQFSKSIYWLLSSLKITSCQLIAYSLGGRLSQTFFLDYPNLVEKLILISSHLGTDDPTEKRKVLLKNNLWVKSLQKDTLQEFLVKWYSQTIFKTLHSQVKIDSAMIHNRMKQNTTALEFYLKNLSLHSQKNNFSSLLHHKDKLCLIYGEQDKKYKKLYQYYQKYGLKTLGIQKCSHSVHTERFDALLPIIESLTTQRK